MKKTICTTEKATATAIEYRTDDFAIITNWRNPYTTGIHGDWRRQVRNALSNSKHHAKLSEKLDRFKPLVLAYSKLLTEKSEILDFVDIPEATVCQICSSGEHLLTPWMIIHNIGHTAISHDIWIKEEIMEIIGLTSYDDSVISIQQQLVDSAASRNGLIPNLNEIIYELFTTWVWWGKTRSENKKLCEYCDKTFAMLMEKHRNEIFWHKYRCPVPLATPQPWLEEILSSLDDEINYVPGVPGFTTKVLKPQNSSLLGG